MGLRNGLARGGHTAVLLCGLGGGLMLAPTVADAGPKTLTIKGTLPHSYDSVGLFRNGGEITPYKVGKVNKGKDPFNTPYEVKIRLNKDMGQVQSGVYATDLRFWYDKNKNGKRDDGNSSACHFVIHDTRSNSMQMQIYGGSTHPIRGSVFRFKPK